MGKKCQNGKHFFLDPSPQWLGDGQKNLHFVHSGQSYGGSKSKVSKNDAKSAHFEADLELGSRFGLERGQKRSKSQKKLRWLDDGPKKIWISAILARVISP